MSVIQCKDCGKDIAQGLKKCPHCGSSKHRSFISRHPILSLAGVIFGASFLIPLTRPAQDGMHDVRPGVRSAPIQAPKTTAQKSQNSESQKPSFDTKKALADSKDFRKSMDEKLKQYYATQSDFLKSKKLADAFSENVASVLSQNLEAEVKDEISQLSKTQRKIFASVMQQTMMEGGQNFYLTTSGPSNEILKAKYSLMSDALAYQLVNKHDLVSIAKGVGFKKVILTDGYNYTVTYTPE